MTAVNERPSGGHPLGSDWEKPTGRLAWFSDVTHKSVGTRYMVTAFVFFLIGGVMALVMRLQLARPESDLIDADTYNQLFTMHGTTMMFLFIIPFIEGLASYLLPLHLGTRDLPFPRYNSFNYYCYLFGGIFLYSSVFFQAVPDSGWFAYVPLSGPEFRPDLSMDFWLFGLVLVEVAAIGAAIELIVVTLRMRAPGLTLDKIPLFVWAMLATACLIVLAFVPLVVGSTLLEADRAIGTVFFDSEAGGHPLLWQHLFWIFGHPEVYVMFLPATGIVSQVIQVHARRAIIAYPLVVVAIVVTAFMSMGLWVHHMYTTGLPPLTLSFFTAASMAIALAAGIQIVAWIGTLWAGRPRLTVPMMYVIGFIITFVLGGITGVMVASVPFDEQAHDTFFIVAHFHYVIIGGVVFPFFAGLYHWMPKFTGRMPSRVLGHVSFWLVFVGFHVTFFPMHLTGLWGMPRRVYTFPRDLGLDFVNMLSTVGAFVLAAGVVVFSVALARCWFTGRPAGRDPWGGDTLEWSVDSPPPRENFMTVPAVADRHPLWGRQPSDDFHPEVREIYTEGPIGFRGTPATSVLDAEPESVVYLPRPTAIPVISPVGLVVMAAGILAETYWISVIGVVVFLAGLVMWAWRNESEHSIVDEVPEVDGEIMDTSGPRAIGWWGFAAALVIGASGLATLVFSTVFLQVNTDTWPVESLFEGWLLPALALLALAVATAGAWRGSLVVRDREKPAAGRSEQLGSAVIALLAGVGATVAIVAYYQAAGIEPGRHAYESAALMFTGAQVLVILGAAAATAVALLRISRYGPAVRPRLLLQGAAMMWGLAVVFWIFSWIVLNVLPGMV